ncbi:MAG: hypothetical protein HPY57_15195 [Ignavibacteria bacterium]|nr:hypothetical protein [Ignavibacteria bacterium]
MKENVKVKDLKINDKFVFISDGTLVDGELLHKEQIGCNQFDLLIRVKDGLVRKKSKDLKLYCVIGE